MHAHTVYCDGKNTVEEMVLSAIDAGCKTFGFSDHAPRPDKLWWCMSDEDMPKYIRDVKECAKKYADKIEVVLGIEFDSHSVIDISEFEYVIGSVHAIKKGGELYDVDCEERVMLDIVNNIYGGDQFAYVRDYYDEVCRLPEKVKCDIVGHFDLVTKYNEGCKYFDVSDERYRKMALESLDVLLEKDYIFEINTGAISRGYRTEPYPADFILRRMVEKGAKIMLNSDSHAKEAVVFHFEQSLEYARACGVKSLYVWKDGKFIETGI